MSLLFSKYADLVLIKKDPAVDALKLFCEIFVLEI